ncbi:uncharacterized protein DS421_8g236630 [Arachis hypogaea]|nr:uncharacterized protein DS421_8g236630 [Arachis hypogaea]
MILHPTPPTIMNCGGFSYSWERGRGELSLKDTQEHRGLALTALLFFFFLLLVWFGFFSHGSLSSYPPAISIFQAKCCFMADFSMYYAVILLLFLLVCLFQ